MNRRRVFLLVHITTPDMGYTQTHGKYKTTNTKRYLG